MKQRITVDQLKELNGEQQGKLREWYKPTDGDWFYRSTVNDTGIYGGSDDWSFGEFTLTQPEAIDLPLLSIGQMIEFLESKLPTLHITKHLKQGMQKEDRYDVFQQGAGSSRKETLCDALWDSVKKALC